MGSNYKFTLNPDDEEDVKTPSYFGDSIIQDAEANRSAQPDDLAYHAQNGGLAKSIDLAFGGQAAKTLNPTPATNLNPGKTLTDPETSDNSGITQSIAEALMGVIPLVAGYAIGGKQGAGTAGTIATPMISQYAENISKDKDKEKARAAELRKIQIQNEAKRQQAIELQGLKDKSATNRLTTEYGFKSDLLDQGNSLQMGRLGYEAKLRDQALTPYQKELRDAQNDPVLAETLARKKALEEARIKKLLATNDPEAAAAIETAKQKAREESRLRIIDAEANARNNVNLQNNFLKNQSREEANKNKPPPMSPVKRMYQEAETDPNVKNFLDQQSAYRQSQINRTNQSVETGQVKNEIQKKDLAASMSVPGKFFNLVGNPDSPPGTAKASPMFVKKVQSAEAALGALEELKNKVKTTNVALLGTDRKAQAGLRALAEAAVRPIIGTGSSYTGNEQENVRLILPDIDTINRYLAGQISGQDFVKTIEDSQRGLHSFVMNQAPAAGYLPAISDNRAKAQALRDQAAKIRAGIQ